MIGTYRDKLAYLLGDRSKYPGGKYPNEQDAGSVSTEATVIGPSGKPLPEWRVRRREMKERAKREAERQGRPVESDTDRQERAAKREPSTTHVDRLHRSAEPDHARLEQAIINAGESLVRRGGSRRELAQILDAAGNVLHEASGTEHRVSIGGQPGTPEYEVVQKIRTPGANVTWVHNHPAEGSLSPADYRTSALPGLKEVIAVTEDGSMYRGKGYDRSIGPLWKGKMDAVSSVIRATPGSRRVGDTFFAHVVNVALQEQGHLQYSYKFGRETQRTYESNKPFIETMLAAARSGGRRVRVRRSRETFSFADGQADRVWMIDPPSPVATAEEWWTFIDEMDEHGVPEELWIDYVPDDLESPALVTLTKPRSEYPGGLYPSELEARQSVHVEVQELPRRSSWRDTAPRNADGQFLNRRGQVLSERSIRSRDNREDPTHPAAIRAAQRAEQADRAIAAVKDDSPNRNLGNQDLSIRTDKRASELLKQSGFKNARDVARTLMTGVAYDNGSVTITSDYGTLSIIGYAERHGHPAVSNAQGRMHYSVSITGSQAYVGMVESDGGYRQSGDTMKVLSNLATFGEKIGLSSVSAGANLDMGGYAWARMGFEAENPTALARSVSERIDRIERKAASLAEDATSQSSQESRAGLTYAHDYQSMREKVESDAAVVAREWSASEFAHLRELIAEHSQDPRLPAILSDIKVGNQKVGRHLLRGTSWSAKLNLKDPAAMDRFKRFAK